MLKGGTEVKQAAEGVLSSKSHPSSTACFIQGMSLFLYVPEAASECKQRHSNILIYIHIDSEKPCINTQNSNKDTECEESSIIIWLQFIKKIYARIAYLQGTYMDTHSQIQPCRYTTPCFVLTSIRLDTFASEMSLAFKGPQEDWKLQKKSGR